MKRKNFAAALSACAVGAYTMCNVFAVGCSSSGGGDNSDASASSSSGAGGSSSGARSSSSSGGSSSSGAGSSSSSSGAGSSSSSSSSSSGAGSSSGGGPDGGIPPCTDPATCVIGDCPACSTPSICCLTKYGTGASAEIHGTCSTSAACSGVVVQCQDPTVGCGTMACCSTPVSNGVTGSACVAVGATGCAPNRPVCSTGAGVGGDAAVVGDPSACPGGAAANDCVAATGTPLAVFGLCVPKDAGAGG